MNSQKTYFLACCAFLLALLLLAHPFSVQAQAPVTPAPATPAPAAPTGVRLIILQARADQKANRFAAASARLQAALPRASATDKQALRVTLADVQYAWGETLSLSSGDGTNRVESQVLSHFQAALAIDRMLRPTQAARDFSGVATADVHFGQPHKVISAYQQALALYHQVGSKEGQAQTLVSLGDAYRNLGQGKKAIGFYQRALPLFQQVGDKDGVAEARSSIASAQGTNPGLTIVHGL